MRQKMKSLPVLAFVLLLLQRNGVCEVTEDFYTFSAKDIRGNEVSLEKYRGKVSLVVNVASQCGFTESYYRDLKRLHDILSFNGKFNVLAFPCNQFGEQEPYDEEVIEALAVEHYGVEFPLFSKIDVVGENAHPAYKNLIAQSSVLPEWNFYKYLVDHNGRVLKAWGTRIPTEDIFDDVKRAVDAAQQQDMTERELMSETTNKDEL